MPSGRGTAGGHGQQPRNSQSAPFRRHLEPIDRPVRIRVSAGTLSRSIRVEVSNAICGSLESVLFSFTGSVPGPWRGTPVKFPAPDSPRSDRAGMLLAGACFVHCVAGPLLLSFAGLAGLTAGSERLEPAFLAGSVIIGTANLIPSFRKKHGRPVCLAMFLGGIVCLFLRRRLFSTSLPMEAAATGLGACLIIGAHALNLRFCHQCRCCTPSAGATSSATGGHSGPAAC